MQILRRKGEKEALKLNNNYQRRRERSDSVFFGRFSLAVQPRLFQHQDFVARLGRHRGQLLLKDGIHFASAVERGAQDQVVEMLLVFEPVRLCASTPP
jgi:hypothetical protein